MEVLNSFLKKRDYKIGKFNVRIIKPLLIYQRKGSRKAYLVTQFYKEGQVKQVRDIRFVNSIETEEHIQVRDILSSISKQANAEHPGLTEIAPHNAFFQKTTNTSLLFDLSLYKLP